MMQDTAFHYLRYPWGVSFTGMLLVAGPAGGVLVDTALPEAVDGFLLPAVPAFRIFSFPRSGWSSIRITTRTMRAETPGCASCAARNSQSTGGAAGLEAAGFRPDLLLRDGVLLKSAGLRFEIIHTPGHSPDSVCVLESASGTLFTGDAFQGCGTVYTGIALYIDPEAYLQSVAKIEALFRQGRIRRILCGHACAPFDGDVPEEETPAFLGNLPRNRAAVLAAARGVSGGSSAARRGGARAAAAPSVSA